jgi:hypothetical protein
MSKIFGVAISIEGTTCHDTLILDNFVTATLGITVPEAGAAAMGSVIKGNLLRTVGIAIDDDSDDFQVVDNVWLTDVNTGTSTAGWDFNVQLAAGNLQTGATGLTDEVPYRKQAE